MDHSTHFFGILSGLSKRGLALVAALMGLTGLFIGSSLVVLEGPAAAWAFTGVAMGIAMMMASTIDIKSVTS